MLQKSARNDRIDAGCSSMYGKMREATGWNEVLGLIG